MLKKYLNVSNGLLELSVGRVFKNLRNRKEDNHPSAYKAYTKYDAHRAGRTNASFPLARQLPYYHVLSLTFRLSQLDESLRSLKSSLDGLYRSRLHFPHQQSVSSAHTNHSVRPTK